VRVAAAHQSQLAGLLHDQMPLPCILVTMAGSPGRCWL